MPDGMNPNVYGCLMVIAFFVGTTICCLLGKAWHEFACKQSYLMLQDEWEERRSGAKDE